MTEYLPSQVDLLGSYPPLVGTLKRTEREIAAALLVRTCQVNGDRWQPVVPRMIGEMLKVDLDAGTEPLASLNNNPFARPDFHELVAEGYATGDLTVGGSPIELTEKAFEAMRRWVRALPFTRPASGDAPKEKP